MKKKETTKHLRDSMCRISLSENEKKTGRDVLIAHMRNHSVRKCSTIRHISQKRMGSRLPASLSFLTRKSMIATIAVILALALGGGASYAAEGAVPGDMLYPMKVRVNEEVRAAVAVGSEADARWDARRAERRLQEATLLAASGELDEKQRSQIEERFERHIERMQKRIERLEEEGKTDIAADIRTRLDAAINAHEDIVDRLEAGEDIDLNTEIRPLLRNVRMHVKEHVEDAPMVTHRMHATSSLSGHVRSTEVIIASTESFIARADVDAQVRASAEATLQQAKDAFAQGQTQGEEGNVDAAIDAFLTAKSLAHEARVAAATEAKILLRLPHLDAETRANARIKVRENHDMRYRSGEKPSDVSGDDMSDEAQTEGERETDTQHSEESEEQESDTMGQGRKGQILRVNTDASVEASVGL